MRKSRYTHGRMTPAKRQFSESQKAARKMNDQLKIETSKDVEIKCFTQPWWDGTHKVGVIQRNNGGWRVETHEDGSHSRINEDYPTLADLTEKWSVTLDQT